MKKRGKSKSCKHDYKHSIDLKTLTSDTAFEFSVDQTSESQHALFSSVAFAKMPQSKVDSNTT